jgi:hypothetical protein
MEATKKISEELLKGLKDTVAQLSDLEKAVLEFEFKKHHAMHSHAELSGLLENIKKEIEEQYGEININLETGEYTESVKK